MAVLPTIKRRLVVDGKDLSDITIDWLAFKSYRRNVWMVDVKTTTGNIHLNCVTIDETVVDGVYVTTMNSVT